jgi:hypothetical protein
MDRIGRLEDIPATLVEHARLSEQRFDVMERQISILHTAAKETNERISALVSSIGDYIRHDMEKRET